MAPRRPLTLLVPALVTVVLTGVLAPAPASAAPAEIFSGTDAQSDVVITSTSGLGTAKRKSIDLRTVRVLEVADGWRVEVGLKKLAPKGSSWDQMVFATFRRGSTVVADVGWTHRSDGLAYAYQHTTEEWCEIADVRRRKRRLSVVVPEACLPDGRTKLRVETATGHFRTDAPVWSRDKKSFGKKIG